jgi:hypothetical protein
MSTTWKQVVLDVADAWREANDSTAKIPVGELPNKVKEGGENIDPELTTLESTLQEILEILPFKGAMASGQYVWKKLTAEGGDLVEFAVSNDENAYPTSGEQDGYWHELFDPTTLIPENIREGVDIWGIIGAIKEGIDLLGITSFTKMAVSTYTVTSDTSMRRNTIPHSLGKEPSMVLVLGNPTKGSNNYMVAFFMPGKSASNNYVNYSWVYLTTSGGFVGWGMDSDTSAKLTSSSINSVNSDGAYYKAGVEYTVIAWG